MFQKDTKKDNLYLNKFWDDHCFWRDVRGRRGKHVF